MDHVDDPDDYMKSFKNLEDFNKMSFTKVRNTRKGTQFKFLQNEVKEVGKISHMLSVGGEPINTSLHDGTHRKKQMASFKSNNKFNKMIEGLSMKGIKIDEADEDEFNEMVGFLVSKMLITRSKFLCILYFETEIF